MSDKIALITGSSSGFGLLTSVELARNGFRVVASMRDLGRRQFLDVAAAAAGVSDRVDVRQLDVTHFDAIPGFVDAAVRDYGRLDVLINNAGFAVGGFAEDLKLDEIRRQFETNFFGAVAMTQAALPITRRQRSGHIIAPGTLLWSPRLPAWSARSPSAAIPPPSMRSKVGASRFVWRSMRWASR